MFAVHDVRRARDVPCIEGTVSCAACPVCSCMVADTGPSVELGGGSLRFSGF